MYEDEHEIIREKEWPLYRAVVFIFISGMVLICCAANIRRCLKELVRAWRYS